MEEKNNPHPHYSADLFCDAFVKLTGFNKEEFMLTINTDKDSALVLHNGKRYVIAPHYLLFELIKNEITDPEEAQNTNLDNLINATEGLTASVEFHRQMAFMLTKEKDVTLYNLALTVSLCSERRGESFWQVLLPLDNTGSLLCKAVNAAAKALGEDVLTARILKHQVDNGLRFYNECENGIFESVSVTTGNHLDGVK